MTGEIKKAATSRRICRNPAGEGNGVAEDAQWPDEIDVARAEAAKKRAEDRIAMRSRKAQICVAEAALKRAGCPNWSNSVIALKTENPLLDFRFFLMKENWTKGGISL